MTIRISDTLVGSDYKTGRYIIYTGMELGFLDAFKALKECERRLPDNKLYNGVTVRRANWTPELERINGAWIDGIAVFPARRESLTDADIRDNGWVMRGAYIPSEARNRRNVGLLVIPEELEVDGRSVIVHPRSIRMLHPFIQDNFQEGRPDKETEFPLASDPARLALRRLLHGNILMYNSLVLRRLNGAGVRPIGRWSHVINEHTVVHYVDVSASPDIELAVSFVREPILRLTEKKNGNGKHESLMRLFRYY